MSAINGDRASQVLEAAQLEHRGPDWKIIGGIAYALLDIAAAIREHTATTVREARRRGL